MTEIDITELLEEYVGLLEKSGIPKDSTESKLMLRAKEEIESLRRSMEFQVQEATDNNNSRLRLLDVIENARNLYESTCKSVREETAGDHVCGMCKWDCDTSIGPSGEHMQECPGFDKDDCFQLNRGKYNDIIFEKTVQESISDTETQV